MIIVKELKDGISATIRMIHDVAPVGAMKAEKARCEEEYGKCVSSKEVDDAMRLYYEWGNVDIIKV